MGTWRLVKDPKKGTGKKPNGAKKRPKERDR